MEQLRELYSGLMDLDVSEAGNLTELKEQHEECYNRFEVIMESAEALHTEFSSEHGELKGSAGLRTKMLGGMFGGDKEKAARIKELEQLVEEVDVILLGAPERDQEITDEVYDLSIDMVAQFDKEFAKDAEHVNILNEAMDFTDDVLREITEAIDALENAEDAEEMDMYTNNAYLDMESDFANEEAADEVNDVTVILGEYREFLHKIGERTVGLHGSDFDFTWGDMLSESFFGDFWGGSAMLDKLGRAQDDMRALYHKVSSLQTEFEDDFEVVNDRVSFRVDQEWENA